MPLGRRYYGFDDNNLKDYQESPAGQLFKALGQGMETYREARKLKAENQMNQMKLYNYARESGRSKEEAADLVRRSYGGPGLIGRLMGKKGFQAPVKDPYETEQLKTQLDLEKKLQDIRLGRVRESRLEAQSSPEALRTEALRKKSLLLKEFSESEKSISDLTPTTPLEKRMKRGSQRELQRFFSQIQQREGDEPSSSLVSYQPGMKFKKGQIIRNHPSGKVLLVTDSTDPSNPEVEELK